MAKIHTEIICLKGIIENKMNIKQKSEKEKQANKVLYISVGAMLAVMALIITLSTVLSRGNSGDEISTDTAAVSDTAAPDTEKRPPVDTLPTITPDTQKDPEPEDKPTVAPETAPTLSLPVDGVMSLHFSDKTLIYSSTMEDYRTHLGIDISAALGDRVHAPAAGVVSDVYTDPLMGKCVKIEHKGGLETIYKNLAPELASGIDIGSSVKLGDVIGYVGESAMIEIAEEPHLHFEAKKNGKYVDPLTCMSDAAKSALEREDSVVE